MILDIAPLATKENNTMQTLNSFTLDTTHKLTLFFRVMMFRMGRFCHKFKIRDCVVYFIPVLVMDNIARVKSSFEMFFHDKPMLSNVFSIMSHEFISMFDFSAFPIWVGGETTISLKSNRDVFSVAFRQNFSSMCNRHFPFFFFSSRDSKIPWNLAFVGIGKFLDNVGRGFFTFVPTDMYPFKSFVPWNSFLKSIHLSDYTKYMTSDVALIF